jgi:hypothetical protein
LYREKKMDKEKGRKGGGGRKEKERKEEGK